MAGNVCEPVLYMKMVYEKFSMQTKIRQPTRIQRQCKIPAYSHRKFNSIAYFMIYLYINGK